MKIKTMLAAVIFSLVGPVSFALSAPAAAVDSTVKIEKSVKKPAKKHAHKVSAKKHKAAKHKKTAPM